MLPVAIDPDSPVETTEKAVVAARSTAPAAAVPGVTCHSAPPAIQGPEDAAIRRPDVKAEVGRAAADGADAMNTAFFGDPAPDAARPGVTIPVPGIGQARFHAAIMPAGRFPLQTTLRAAIPTLDENLALSGLAAACARMAGLAARMGAGHGLKVIDGMGAAAIAVARVTSRRG